MENFSNEAYFLFFSSLASRTRLAIIDELRDHLKTLSEISNSLKQEEKTILRNLQQLEQYFFVQSEGEGKEKRYSLNREIIQPLSEILAFYASKHCPGLKECIPPEKLKEYMKKEADKAIYIEHE